MLQTEVLRPWIQLSFDTLRLGLQVQSSVMSVFNNGRALITPVAHAPEAPTPLASALAGTPYASEVVQAVTDEITSAAGTVPVKPRASSQRARRGGAPKAAKGAAKKLSTRKAPSRRKG